MEIKVGVATCGVSAGADKVLFKLKDFYKEDSSIQIKEVGCIGLCFLEPIVEVRYDDGRVEYYGRVTEKDVEILQKEPSKLSHKKIDESVLNIEKYQKRIVLENAGRISPYNIDDYVKQQGYEALKKALSKKQEEIIKEIKESGLRGRGGAGFPTGLKWEFVFKEKSEEKYIICNADEGDPGAFMDRNVLESDPHRVIEGMIIAAYTVGANKGIIYIRAEYPKAIETLKIALKQAKEKGFLGKNILGSNFSFDIEIFQGAGAFVCGEETALIASIEGKRGHPRVRPPFPAQKGLFGKPTLINNVETFANIPWIIRHSAKEFIKYGTDKSKGTKVFSLAGKVKNTGLVEVPFGITIKDLVFKVGGGIKEDKEVKAVQIGGPSGGCVPKSLFNTQIDYEELKKVGAIVGSGGVIVLDETSCMVDVAKYFLSFTQKESCGKCTFCRIGTKRMLEILERITNGEGKEEDLDKLEDLAKKIQENSLCALGKTAPNPVLTTLKYFRDEYLAHIREKRCPAKVCKALIRVVIDEDKCIGCGACSNVCPTNTIIKLENGKYRINQDGCIKCESCIGICPTKAIYKDS